ncbi:hypothetical protein [Nostoc sp.]|uniref:hypothetical protein n=1 Tax=Nostoc sp. TaxID=1180 RepID=UPI002FFA8423
MSNLIKPFFTLTYNQLGAFSSLENFWDLFDIAFGTQYDRTVARTVRSQLQASDCSQLPQVELVSNNILGNTNRTYAVRKNTNKETIFANSLKGAANRYLLRASPISNVSGTAIYLDTNNNLAFNSTDELIAIVQGSTGLNLTASDFAYV